MEVADAELDADEAEDLEPELPHALTTAAIRNRQAAIAASLVVRMAWLIPRLSSLSAAYSPALPVAKLPLDSGGSADAMVTRLSTILCPAKRALKAALR
ncbi:MAG TPA: hypothetical protein VLW51_08235 [Solirubrobacteraceae bacterium]|nr:hypothetical protein [Solirubrobacteraceae bacterium]